MKKILFIMSLVLILMSSSVYAEGFKVKIDGKNMPVNEVKVVIDDNELTTDFKSYVTNGRTFVPIREITESLGAKVEWDAKTKSATISLDDKKVKLQIDSNIVYINGEKKTLNGDSVPKFATYTYPRNETKTMVPLRFLSETFGYDVKWDEKNYIASIKTIEEIETEGIEFPKEIENKNEDKIDNNLKEDENKDETTSKKEVSKKIKSDGPVTIVLDAGHGGSDPGAMGYDNKTKEKDLTLDITTKLYEKLLADGYDVHMTRTSDKAVDLYERPEIANKLNAEIFLSVHINSSTSESPSGIEVHYAPAIPNKLKTVEQSPLAECLQKSLLKETNATNRGTKASGALVVLRKTNNVAALAELGFISNEKELDMLKDDDYQDKLATGLYNGLVDYINNYVE